MAQKLLNSVIQRYSIVAPATSNPVDIPHGIPALIEFSRRHGNTSAMDLARHLAGLTEVRLAGIACGLLITRSYIAPVLSSIGDEMNQELLEWFFPEPSTVSVTAADLQQMHHDADQVQVRLDEYETVQRDMLSAYGKVQTQLAKAREALEVEKAGHEETKRDLDRQTTSRANAEVELGNLRAESETEMSAEEEIPELETIEEAEDESSTANGAIPQSVPDEQNPALDAQVKRLQEQLRVEQANYRFVFKKKEIFRLGGMKLKQDFEKLKADYQVLEDGTELKKKYDELQGDYNKLEDSRDTLQETCEALEGQADVQVVNGLRDQMAADNTHNERRIEGLLTQLGCETTSREEAQTIASELRASCKKLKAELKAANKKCENLGSSSEELDNEDGAERTNEDGDEEPTDWKAEYDRLEVEFANLNDLYDQLNAERAGPAEDTDESQQSEEVDFDPLYDASDRGDHDGDDRAGSEGHEEDQGYEDDKPDTSNNDEQSSDDEDFDNKPSYGQRILLTMNASAPEFVPSVRPSRPVPPILPYNQAYIVSQQGYNFVAPPEPPVSSAHSPLQVPFTARSPAPKATGPGHVKNAHVRAVNEDVMRKNWRRKSGMPDRDEEVILAPEDEVEIGM